MPNGIERRAQSPKAMIASVLDPRRKKPPIFKGPHAQFLRTLWLNRATHYKNPGPAVKNFLARTTVAVQHVPIPEELISRPGANRRGGNHNPPPPRAPKPPSIEILRPYFAMVDGIQTYILRVFRTSSAIYPDNSPPEAWHGQLRNAALVIETNRDGVPSHMWTPLGKIKICEGQTPYTPRVLQALIRDLGLQELYSWELSGVNCPSGSTLYRVQRSQMGESLPEPEFRKERLVEAGDIETAWNEIYWRGRDLIV